MPARLRPLIRTLVVLALALAFPTGVSGQAIIDAVKRNDLAAVRQMLEANPRCVSVTDGDGATPLHWAANGGNLDIVRMLIQNGADVNVRQHNGWTPVHSAADGDRFESIRILVEKGADVNALSQDGNAPIHFAARAGCCGTIAFLRTVGVDVDSPNTDGNTPLAVAAWYGQMSAGRLLIAVGADIRRKNKAGKTALDEAIRSGKADFARILTEYQAALDERAVRDTARQITGLNLRTGYAAWTEAKAVTNSVYRDDFSAVAPRPEWTATVPGTDVGALRISISPIGGRRFLGDFTNQNILLNVAHLPDHKEIAIAFDLFIIRTMDGNDANPPNGPDIWSLSVVDGPTLIQTTFSNIFPDQSPKVKNQAYPGEYPGDHNEATAGSFEKNSLGYTVPLRGQIIPMDTVYRLRYTFSHSNPAVLFRFTGRGMQALDDESWGIANVRVAVGVTAAPTPSSTLTAHSAPKSRITVRPTPPRATTIHRAGTKPAPRSVARKAKPATRTQSKPAVRRIHDKKQAPKP
jgi:ankyrin repeat protein